MKSIRAKLFVYFISFLIVFIIFFVLLNSIFLKHYYIYVQKRNFNKIYNELIPTFKRPEDVDFTKFEQLALRDGTNLMIFNNDLKLVFNALAPRRNIPLGPPPRKNNRLNKNDKESHFADLIRENIDKADKNGVFKVISNQNIFEEMVFIKKINNRDYVVLFKSLTILTSNAVLLNNFMIIMAIIISVLGSILTYFFSGYMTKRIIRLNKISKKIASLDFSEDFDEITEDEIGQLGNSINIMSKKLETALNELKSDLERKNELDQMRKNFISSVSHELKTPIGLIKGCTEVLKYDILKDSDKKEEYFNNIIQETDRMDMLVKDMLHISYMESGSFLVNKSEFYMDNLIEEIFAKYTKKFGDSNIQVNKVIIENTIVKADKTRILQVLVNYLENALRHLDMKKFIEIKMEKLNSKLKVSIFNSGQNIPDSEIDNIWLSFYKTDKAHSRNSGNSGLGLSIVKSIILSHEGEYGVINEKNGVRFYFII